ncbi:Dyp-type peroxidase [Glaciihabitans arcticus]|uniref:Dyp-type peroxidase n=1 Tax=Glaciihabitans arcticus TaxID=2668039 RepID=UPI0013872392|nr:Dyp-type peroxidase [Glaciihabitans arcticus]
MTESGPRNEPTFRPSRRGLLSAALGGAAGLALGATGGVALTRTDTPAPASTPAPTEVVPVRGEHQAGVHLPASPQQFGALLVLDTAATDTGWLAALGARIVALGSDDALLPDGAGDLTVTVGIGPRLVPDGLPGSTDLPGFADDNEIDPGARGGDVLLAAYSSDPTVLAAVLADLALLVPGAVTRWQQFVFRGKGSGTKARNPLGFMDGIVVPHTSAEFADGVWIPDGPAAGGSILVIRRLRLDTSAFRALEVGEREAVIGRRLSDGAPLSGGAPDDQVDLRAKTPEGELLVPARSHARAAHPSFTGSSLMFRRSYSFENDGETGLVFMSFQNELRTFVVTQQRLDEVDALRTFSTPTASATFLVLPGFDDERPLGSSLL